MIDWPAFFVGMLIPAIAFAALRPIIAFRERRRDARLAIAFRRFEDSNPWRAARIKDVNPWCAVRIEGRLAWHRRMGQGHQFAIEGIAPFAEAAWLARSFFEGRRSCVVREPELDCVHGLEERCREGLTRILIHHEEGRSPAEEKA